MSWLNTMPSCNFAWKKNFKRHYCITLLLLLFSFFSSSDFDNKHQLKLYYYHTRQLLELYLLDETLLGKNQRKTYLKGNNTIYFLINNISSLFIFYSFNCCDSVFLNLENYFFFCIMIIIFIQPRSILNWSATK